MIAYMLVSGGVSPFFNRNSVKLERNIVGGNADMEHDSLLGVSVEAKSFIKSLLIVSPTERWSAEQCLKHKWLYSVDLANPHRSEQGRLQTHALRGWLARRRWVKCCSAVRATLRIVRIREEEEDREKGRTVRETLLIFHLIENYGREAACLSVRLLAGGKLLTCKYVEYYMLSLNMI